MRQTNDCPEKPTPEEDDPLGQCFIMKEIQEVVYINKAGRKLFVTHTSETLRREGTKRIRTQ